VKVNLDFAYLLLSQSRLCYRRTSSKINARKAVINREKDQNATVLCYSKMAGKGILIRNPIKITLINIRDLK